MLIKLFLLSQLLVTAIAKTPLHLLALVPLGQGSAQHCVDRGEELLSAALLAAQIANTNILAEYQLEIVQVETSNCTHDSFSLTLANFVAELTSRSRTVVGVVGMMCSSAVLSVSPLASHVGIDILQITSGTVSPLSIGNAREKVRIDRLYQTASPSTVFNDKLIHLINQNNVTRLAVIRHIGTFFIEHDIISTDLHAKLGNRVNITDFEIQFDDNTEVPRILDSIVSSNDGIRVIYASVTIREARELLCNSLSSERGAEIVYPRNQWVFHSHTYEELVQATSTCSKSEMSRALVGVVLLQHSDRDESNRSITLTHTNYTYNSYLERYRQELNGNNTLCDKSPGIIHANALYDSVLAFAIAINNSLDTLDQAQLSGYGFQNSTSRHSNAFVTETLKNELDKLSFDGASGPVSFNNDTHGISRNTTVRVVVVVGNNTELLVKHPLMLGSFPSQDDKIHNALPIATMVLVLILVLAHTTTLLLFGYYWSDPDIKATSPGLSLILFVACYMLDISLLLTAIRYSYATNEQFVICCVFENWLLFIGIQLIFATLLMRLLRVHRIFFHYSKLGRLWSDYSMLLAILVFASFAVILLTLWMAIDTPTLGIQTTFVSATQTPFFSVVLSCKSEFFPIWILLLLGYTGFVMAMVFLLAFRTRKIKLESFKDTKTVNIFVYTTVVCFMFLMVVSLIFEGVGDQVVAFVFRVLALSSVAVACTCFLFLPKIYSAQRLRKNPRRKSITTQNSGAFVAPKGCMTTSF